MSIVKSDNDDDLNSSSSSNDDDVTFTFQESLSELSELVGTAGLEVKGIMVQKLQNVNTRVILLFLLSHHHHHHPHHPHHHHSYHYIVDICRIWKNC